MQRNVPQAKSRPYRSSKRPRPCDQCRGRKVKCLLLREPSCERCRDEEVLCTFSRRQSRQSSRPQALRSSVTPSRGLDHSLPGHVLLQPNTAHPYRSEQDNNEYMLSLNPGPNTTARTVDSAMPGVDPYQSRPLTQVSQGLDDVRKATALFLGPSSSSDPWLLRHCRYDQSGLHSFGTLRFRNAGGVPTSDKIPVQFRIIDDNSTANGGTTPRSDDNHTSRIRLAEMIVPAQGVRLLRL